MNQDNLRVKCEICQDDDSWVGNGDGTDECLECGNIQANQ